MKRKLLQRKPMKKKSTKGTCMKKGLSHKSRCVCADNSGAKEVEIIAVIGHKSRKRMKPKAGIADMVNVVVKKGLPKASEIKGVVAKEVGERWPKVAGLASAVI